MMSMEDLALDLPEEMTMQANSDASSAVYDGEISDEYIIFKRVPYLDKPELSRLMTPECWDEYEKKTKRCWAAECVCTRCGGEFIAGYQSKETAFSKCGGHWRRKGILLTNGPDGANYAGFESEENIDVMAYWEGDSLTCPVCHGEASLISLKDFGKQRTWNFLIGDIQIVNGYAGIFYWLCSKIVFPDGTCHMEYRPREALLIDESGKLRRFSHTVYGQFGETDRGQWEYIKSYRPADGNLSRIGYYSYECGKGRKCFHAYICPVVYDDLEASTAEKTGLLDYMNISGENPEEYLRLWSRHHNVENLLKADWETLVESIIPGRDSDLRYRFDPIPDSDQIDWKQKKPHLMLGLKKEDFRAGQKMHFSEDDLRAFKGYCAEIEKISLEQFYSYICSFGVNNIERLLRSLDTEKGFWKLENIESYLKKQKMNNGTGLEMLLDYREFSKGLNALHTKRDYFPKQLRAMHDRAAASFAKTKTAADAEFEALRKELEGLEWSNGEFCIRLPRSANDLKQEGEKLQHCVGSYTTKHLSGKDVIFFVRHARRPERSWLTLDINLSGLPKEVQLHGYKNELLNNGKHLKIPQKGRDFIDQWKVKVLLPWYAKRIRERSKEEKTA